MSKYLFFIFCIFVSCVFFQGEAKASNATEFLEEMVVTARYEELKREASTHITVVDEQEIKMSPAMDLGEFLAEKNIGHIQKYPGSLTSIGIRGFKTETHGNDLEGRVLILLNGRRAGTGNVAKILTKNIERIEIVRGPSSVQYGSAAIGGVINVITKQGQGKPSLALQGELGSFGYEEGSASFSGAIQDFDFSASVSRSTRDDYDTADGEDYANTGYDEKKYLSLNLGYEFLPENRIGLIYNGFDADKIGSPSYISQNDLDDYSDKSNESVDFIYDGATQDGEFSWKARYFVGEDENKWVDPTGSNPKVFDDGQASKTETDQQGLQAQLSWSSSGYQLTAGADWVNYKIDSDFDPNRTEYDNPSYFLLGKAMFYQDRLIFSGGARYDDFEVEVKEGQGGSEDDDRVTPRLGLTYIPWQNFKIRTNYSQGFKMPSAQQLAANYQSMYGTYMGNPNLDPEESETVDLGLDMAFKGFNTSLTYFTTDFEDKIEQFAKAKGVQTWENIGEATVSGFEGELSYNLASIWDWSWRIEPYFNFTYLTEFEDEETGDDLLYTSETNLSYGISVSDGKGFSVYINFAYTGEQDVEDWESGDYPAPVVEKGGFTVANLSIQKKVLNFNSFGDLTLKGEVRNLLDKDYSYVKGYPMPGRSFILGIKYNL